MDEKNTIAKELGELQQTRAEKSEEIKELTLRIDKLNFRLAEIDRNSDEPVVTDHAIIRYLERVKKMDIEKIKSEILTDKLKKQISVLGTAKYPADGFIVRVVGNKVVTVITDEDDVD